MSTVTDILARIDAKIYSIIDDPDSIADYKLGQKSVSRSQILQRLTTLRETYQKLAESEPYEDIRHIASDYGDFGEDLSELIGDQT